MYTHHLDTIARTRQDEMRAAARRAALGRSRHRRTSVEWVGYALITAGVRLAARPRTLDRVLAVGS